MNNWTGTEASPLLSGYFQFLQIMETAHEKQTYFDEFSSVQSYMRISAELKVFLG